MMTSSLTPACVSLMTCASGLVGRMSVGNVAGADGWPALSGGTGWVCAPEFCGWQMADRADSRTAAPKKVFRQYVFIFQESQRVLSGASGLDGLTIPDRNHSTVVFRHSASVAAAMRLGLFGRILKRHSRRRRRRQF